MKKFNIVLSFLFILLFFLIFSTKLLPEINNPESDNTNFIYHNYFNYNISKNEVKNYVVASYTIVYALSIILVLSVIGIVIVILYKEYKKYRKNLSIYYKYKYNTIKTIMSSVILSFIYACGIFLIIYFPLKYIIKTFALSSTNYAKIFYPQLFFIMLLIVLLILIVFLIYKSIKLALSD